MAALAVDHVQVSVPDLTAASEYLQAVGWTLKFEERPFVTEPRPYFRNTGKGLVFLTRGRTALECVNGSSETGAASWTPILSGAAQVPAETRAGLPFELPPRMQASWVGPLATLALRADRRTGPLELEGLVLATSDPEASRAFLRQLGFREGSGDDEGMLVFPAGFVGMGLRVTVVPRTVALPRGTLVDDLGTSLIALICRDLETDLSSYRAQGIPATDIFRYRIHGRDIANAILEGPGGERVELIQIGRN